VPDTLALIPSTDPAVAGPCCWRSTAVNRALRAATMGVLLLSPIALSACSAGQVSQTAGQHRDKVGAMAEVGEIRLRAVEFAYPRGGIYDAGDDADLLMAIVNEGEEDDTLVDISGEGFGDVEIDDNSSTRSGRSGSAREIEIPANDTVFVDGDELSISLTDLDDSLTTGQSLELTFTFENAGEVTIPVTVTTSEDEVRREEGFNFHEGEGSEESASGESAG
jgi:copper(I)-binding protein